MSQIINYGDDTPQIDTDKAASLSALITKMEQRRARVKNLESALKEANASLAEIEKDSGPKLMQEIGTDKFRTTEGFEVEVATTYRHSLPKERKHKGHKILRDLNQGAAIRNVVLVEFTVGEDEKAEKLMEKLRKKGFTVSRDEMIHSATLKAILTELVEKGTVVPGLKEVFGWFKEQKLKVTRKK